MNAVAIALMFPMGVAVCAAMGVLSWGLFLEARDNREWRERKLVL